MLDCLSDGQFHSGEKLGQKLGLTRSGIWKLVQHCKSLDIHLESITNKGYRLQQPITLLKKDKILENIFSPFRQELQDIEIFDSISSTNDYLIEKTQKNITGNWVCIAESQSQGRGRMGRYWVSPFARNLYLSLLWRMEMDIASLSSLSLMTATILAKTLRHYQISEGLGLKWPNDVMWNHKKLAGILIELSAEAHTSCNAVIGIGVNIAMPNSKNKEISQPWINLEQITQKHINRNEFAAVLLNHLIEALFVFQTKGFAPFRDEWEALDLTKGQDLNLMTSGSIISGQGQGINEQGHLLVKVGNNVRAFASGEVSVRVL